MGNSCGGEKICTLILLGMEQAGKSSITRRLRGEDFESEWNPTVGFSCDEIDVNKQRCYVYDVGGDVTMRGQWVKHSRVCDGIMFVVDGGETSSVEQSKNLLVDLSAHDDFSRLPIQVCISNFTAKLLNLLALKLFEKSFTTNIVKKISLLKLQKCLNKKNVYRFKIVFL